MDTDKQVREVQETIRRSLSKFLGSPLNAGSVTVITEQIRRIVADAKMTLPSNTAWIMLQRWFESEGQALGDNGELYNGHVLVGTIDRNSVKFNIQVKVNPDDPTRLDCSLFEYALKLEKPVSFVSSTFVLRDTEENPVTAKEFEEMHGRAPIQDDLDRINCPIIGEAGHWCCGVCPKHNKARFVCGCLAMEKS